MHSAAFDIQKVPLSLWRFPEWFKTNRKKEYILVICVLPRALSTLSLECTKSLPKKKKELLKLSPCCKAEDWNSGFKWKTPDGDGRVCR